VDALRKEGLSKISIAHTTQPVVWQLVFGIPKLAFAIARLGFQIPKLAFQIARLAFWIPKPVPAYTKPITSGKP